MENIIEPPSPSILLENMRSGDGVAGLGPRDFVHFLVATDALLDPAAPHATPEGLAFTQECLTATEGDDDVMNHVALRRDFPDKWSFWLDVTRPHAMSAKAFKKALHVLGHCQSIAVRYFTSLYLVLMICSLSVPSGTSCSEVTPSPCMQT